MHIQTTMTEPEKIERDKDEVAVDSCRFLFQYRSMDKDFMVHIEASSLNDAMVKFATHYHLIDEVYKIVKFINNSPPCEHPFASVVSKCDGEINHCLKCAETLPTFLNTF